MSVITAAYEQTKADGLLAEVIGRHETLGTTDFYFPLKELVRLLDETLECLPRPVLSLNRPHSDGITMVHRVEWRGLVFSSTSPRPLVLS
jgi:hypothetical protein